MIAVFLCTVLISAMLMIAGVFVNSSRHYNFKMPLENIVAERRRISNYPVAYCKILRITFKKKYVGFNNFPF
jgi:hypothetical protein